MELFLDFKKKVNITIQLIIQKLFLSGFLTGIWKKNQKAIIFWKINWFIEIFLLRYVYFVMIIRFCSKKCKFISPSVRLKKDLEKIFTQF
jgi:hypothetical protein